MDLKHAFNKFFRHGPQEEDLREEVESHIAMRADYEGIDRNEACRRFGNTLKIQEQMRGVWIGRFWETLMQDVRYILRMWRRTPAFAIAAVLVLGLGLGASTALFSVLDRILFRSLPYPDAGRLVSLGLSMTPFPTEIMPERGYPEYWHPVPEPFESITTILSAERPCDLIGTQPERLKCAMVEANLLTVLGCPVFIGRSFLAADDRPGAPTVALISYQVWTRRFGKDPKAVGRSLNLDGKWVIIAGVLPESFEMPMGNADVIVPQQLSPLDPGGGATRFLWGIARLRKGATLAQAQAAAQSRFEGMARALGPRIREQATGVVRPLLDRQVGDASRTAWLLLGAVAALFLIACVSILNLMLARIASKQHEFAVRSAVGAGRLRLARLAVTESILLSFAGGVVGWIIAEFLLCFFIRMAPATIPKIHQASLDARVFAFASTLAVLSGILVSMWPSMAIWRSGRCQGMRSTAARRRARFMLVSIQVAVTITLLGGSALFLRTLSRLTSIPLGFEAERVIIMSATLNRVKYPQFAQQSAFFYDLLRRARHMPGAVAASLSDSMPPFGVLVMVSNVAIDGGPFPRDGSTPDIRQHFITPGYFQTFGIPILKGRAFNESDANEGEPAAILSEAAAKILFPGQNPLGRRVRPQPMHPWHVVVGVARDLRNMGLRSEPQSELYFVHRTGDWISLPTSLAVRTTMKPGPAAALLRQVAAGLDSNLPVEITTLENEVAGLSERPRFIAFILTAFAAVALVLAAMGLYGVISYLIAQRKRDIAIRMAIGARPRNVFLSFAGEAANWVASGILLGVPLAWIGTRSVKSQLFETSPADAVSWGIALLVLLLTLAAAVVRPLVHAMNIDPIEVLREE